MLLTITWFPRSWVQIRTAGKIVYIDPAYMKVCFAGYPKKIEYSSWPDPIDSLPEGLERGDIILVTHHHKDHCKRGTLKRLRRSDTLVLAPKRCRKELGEAMTTFGPGGKVSHDGVSIQAVPAYNTEHGSSTHKQHRKGQGVGYLIAMEGRRLYHAGDTDFIPEMRELGEVDIAFLPIGGKFTMDISEAVEATIAISPGAVVPIHRFGADQRVFAQEVERKLGIPCLPLEIGQAHQLEA